MNSISPLNTEILTFLMTDVVGSTRLWESDPRLMSVRLEKLDRMIQDCVTQNNGLVIGERGEGDSHFCVFKSPADSLIAAALLQSTLSEMSEEIRLTVRGAIHTGEVQHRGSDYYGPVINRCARIRELSYGGQILVSASTQQFGHWVTPNLVLESVGTHRLRDLAEPVALFQLSKSGAINSFPPLRSLSKHPNNLPIQLSSFVGRSTQIEQISSLLVNQRLVTLVGTGGSGKTRLALQVAAESTNVFPDGAWFVELSEILRPEQTMDWIIRSLGVSSSDYQIGRLAEVLGDGKQLLILDNCEHVVESAAAIARELLTLCPNLVILSTSRVPLGVPGEQVYRCPGLTLPAFDDPNSALQSEAVLLLRERCRGLGNELHVSQYSAVHLYELCRRLDGLPLGLEIVSGALAILSPEAVVNQLQFFLNQTADQPANSQRQKTMVATLNWSASLLSETALELLNRLTVLTGSWTPESVREICGFGKVAKDEIVKLLRTLTNHSLIFSEQSLDGSVRLRMLQSTHDILLLSYRPSKLLKGRFTSYFLRLARNAKVRSADDLNGFSSDYPNIIISVNEAFESGDLDWIEAVLELRFYWIKAGRFREAIEWLNRAVVALEGDLVRLGQAHNALGALWIRMANEDQALVHLELAEASLKDIRGVEWVKVVLNLATIDIKKESYESATIRLEQCEAECIRISDRTYLGWVLINLGVSRLCRNEYSETTLSNFLRAAEFGKAVQNPSIEAIALGDASETCLLRGELSECLKHALTALTLGEDAFEKFELAGTILMLALSAVKLENPVVAATLHAVGHQMTAQYQFVFQPRQIEMHDQTVQYLRDHVNEQKGAQRRIKNLSPSELFSCAREQVLQLSKSVPTY